MRNKINDVTTKICVELDFKDIYFANYGINWLWESQTNDRKYFGCILFCKKTGIVQELCNSAPPSF